MLFGEHFDKAAEARAIGDGGLDLDLEPAGEHVAEGETPEAEDTESASSDQVDQGAGEDAPEESGESPAGDEEEVAPARRDEDLPAETREQLKKYSQLLTVIQHDPELSNLIVQHLERKQGGGAPRQQPSAEPETILDRQEYADLDDHEFAVEEKKAQRLMASVERRIGPVREQLQAHEGTVRKTEGLFERMAAQSEMQDLREQYPDWNKNVDPKALAQKKKELPNARVVDLYEMLDYRNVQARAKRDAVRGGKIVRRPTTATGSSRTQSPSKIRGIKDFDSAIDAAAEELGYRFG